MMFAKAVIISLAFFFQSLLLCAQGSNYIFYLESDPASLNMFLDILNDGLENNIRLEVKTLERLDRNKHIYGISLDDSAHCLKSCKDSNSFSHIVANILPKGEALWLKLTRNSSSILIADARKRTIDIADISKFNAQYERDGAYLSVAILLHELYEQFYLQHIARTEAGEATEFQLAQAHAHANQREGNYYHRDLQKDVSKVYPRFILIRFNSLTDNSRIIYRAYYKRGNIYKVESEHL